MNLHRLLLDREAKGRPVTIGMVGARMRLHVRDSGPRGAPTLILMHGFGSSLHTWEARAQALGPQYRVIRYDAPGAGLTGAEPTGDNTDARRRSPARPHAAFASFSRKPCALANSAMAASAWALGRAMKGGRTRAQPGSPL